MYIYVYFPNVGTSSRHGTNPKVNVFEVR